MCPPIIVLWCHGHRHRQHIATPLRKIEEQQRSSKIVIEQSGGRRIFFLRTLESVWPATACSLCLGNAVISLIFPNCTSQHCAKNCFREITSLSEVTFQKKVKKVKSRNTTVTITAKRSGTLPFK